MDAGAELVAGSHNRNELIVIRPEGEVGYFYMLPVKRLAEVEAISNSVKKLHPDNTVEVANQDVNISMATNGNSRSIVDIDEDLHSRQLAVYGRDAMRRLFGANVLISGVQGLGVEITKNVILAGVKSVTLHDTANVEMRGLSRNFYFTESDVGKNKAIAYSNKLQELNTAVAVLTLTSKLSKEDLSRFQSISMKLSKDYKPENTSAE